jgi:hypothetical protein
MGFSPTTDLTAVITLINAIEAKLDGATGLAALKDLLDAILVDTSTTLEAKLDAIGPIVDAIEAKLDGATGLAALKDLLDAILVDTSTTLEAKLDAIGPIVDAIKAQTDKLAGEAVVEGTVTANWNTSTGTSGEAGEDLVTIGAATTRYKLHSLLLDVSTLTDGAKIHVKLFMKVNGNEKKIYDQEFTIPTGTTPPDTDGLWIVNGTVGIHDTLRVEVYSDTNESKAIAYTYMLEAM